MPQVNPTDPNDPTALADLDHWKFTNGRWTYTTGSAGGTLGNAAVTNIFNPNVQGSGNLLGDMALYSPMAQAGSYALQDIHKQNQAVANQPTQELDTANSAAERQRMSGLIGQLQNQAQTGNGSWQQRLAQSTGQANNAAIALGQSMPGVNRLSSQRSAANAVGADNQRAVGQGNILRAQTQQNAQSQLDSLLSGQGQQDVTESTAQGAARQSAREMRAQMDAANTKNAVNQASGIAQAGAAAATLLSDGGPVPGKPKVFGDDEKNDTVPAWLSPGEIVLPRSVVDGPDAPAKASAFVQALRARGGNHFADGGQAAPTGTGGAAIFNPLWQDLTDRNNVGPYASGAKLDTHNFDENRTNTLSNVDSLTRSAAGAGPTTAPQEMQSATDSGLAAALASRGGSRGMGSAAAGNNAIATGAQSLQQSAGGAASQAAREQSAGVDATTRALLAQRQRDMAMAQAQQQAAFRDQQINNGISLEQQALMRNIIGGVGQAGVGIAGMLGKSGGPNFNANEGYGGAARLREDDGFNTSGSADDWSSAGLFDHSAPGDWEVGAGANAAHGGQISSRSALADALAGKYADGGKVEPDRVPLRAWGAGDPFAKPFGSDDALPPEEPSFLDMLRDGWALGQRNQAQGHTNLLGAIGSLGNTLMPSAAAAEPAPAVAPPVAAPLSRQDELRAWFKLHPPRSSYVEPKKMADGGVAAPTLAELLENSGVSNMSIGAPAQSAFEQPQGVSEMTTPPPGFDMDARGVISKPEPQSAWQAVKQSVGDEWAPEEGVAPPTKQELAAKKGVGDRGASGGNQPSGESSSPPIPTAAPISIPGNRAEAETGEGLKLGLESEGAKTLIAQKVAEDQAHMRVAQAKVYDDAAKEQADFDSRAHSSTEEAMRGVQEAKDAFSKIDTSVDPGRYWASRSTGGKIAGIIGLALGAIGAGNDGINRAAGMMTQAIDRDIDAQKAEHEIRLKKGQQSIDAAQSLYSMMHSRLGDDRAAMAAAHAAAYQRAAMQLEQAAAKYASPMAQAQGKAAAAVMYQKAAEQDNATYGHTLQAIEMRQKRADAGGVGGATKTQKEGADAMRNLNAVAQNAGAKLLALIDEKGTGEMTGSTEDKMRQLVLEIAEAKAKMASPNTEAGDPTVQRQVQNMFKPGWWQSSSTAKEAIQNVLDLASEREKAYSASVGGR